MIRRWIRRVANYLLDLLDDHYDDDYWVEDEETAQQREALYDWKNDRVVRKEGL